MATHNQPTAVDYAHEKQDVAYLEHARTTDSSLELRKELTLSGVDMKNSQAVKGDDSDGKVEWTLRGKLSAVFLAALYTGMLALRTQLPLIRSSSALTFTGSQVILYFTGGSLSFIEADLGISRGISWLPTANILAIAAVCPYAGYLQDLFGKRYIALFGSACICIGCILVATGHSFAQLLAGMAISGVGAGTGELTGLAG